MVPFQISQSRIPIKIDQSLRTHPIEPTFIQVMDTPQHACLRCLEVFPSLLSSAVCSSQGFAPTPEGVLHGVVVLMVAIANFFVY